MKKIKIGIVGCGKQAEKHISGLKKIPGLDIVLSDKDPAFAQSMAEQTDTTWYEDPEAIFEDKALEAVVISTPTHSHIPLILEAVRFGKHVFCEKPLTYSLDQAEELKKTAAQQTDRVVLLGYVYRYVPIFEQGFRCFRDQAVDGISLTMGKPLSAYFRLGGRGSHQAWKHKKASGGGAINEMLVHMIDLALWYFGPLEDIEVISCDIRSPERVINGERVVADAEDYILVKGTGSSGIDIFCQADLITPAFTQFVEIQAEHGSFMGSIQQEMPSYVFLKEPAGGFGQGKTDFRYGQRNYFDMQMLYFVHCIIKGVLPDRNTIGDSLDLMRVIDIIVKQVKDRFAIYD